VHLGELVPNAASEIPGIRPATIGFEVGLHPARVDPNVVIGEEDEVARRRAHRRIARPRQSHFGFEQAAKRQGLSIRRDDLVRAKDRAKRAPSSARARASASACSGSPCVSQLE